MPIDNLVPGNVNPPVSLTKLYTGIPMLDVIVGLMGTVILAVIGWAWHFSSRTNERLATLEADKVSLKELLDIRLQYVSEGMHNINERLARIELKLDKE